MSAVSKDSVTSPIERRDIRSDALPVKRDRDHVHKWSMGIRTDARVRAGLGEPKGGEKRPEKLWSQLNTERKSHANTTPRPYFTNQKQVCQANAGTRLVRMADAQLDAAEGSSNPLSKSLLELLPGQYNNIGQSGDEGVFYSFDRTESPHRKIDLGNLVDLAEKKWANEQTEKMIEGEYEVLDAEGETVVVRRGKGRKSPRQRALKVQTVPVSKAVEEDDDFELI